MERHGRNPQRRGLAGRTRTGSRRALLFGAAAGFGFALQTAVTKRFRGEIGIGRLAPALLGLASALYGVVLLAGAPQPEAVVISGANPAAMT